MRKRQVAMFGSARPEPTTQIYKECLEAARLLTAQGFTISTGGGPGLMEACNKGATEVCENGHCSLGYSIYLPFEAETNKFVQDDTHHSTFHSRLEQFCDDNDGFIALPGGYGTLLEILMVIQLIQVNHFQKPLVIVGDMWADVMKEMSLTLHSHSYISDCDKRLWHEVRTPKEAVSLMLELLPKES